MPLSTITAGACVIYQGDQYEVRSVDGNVLELVYDTGCFFRFVHVSSVTGCLPPAIPTVASLPAPAAGQGAGTRRRRYRSAVVAVTRHDEEVERLRASNLAAFAAHAAYLAAEIRR